MSKSDVTEEQWQEYRDWLDLRRYGQLIALGHQSGVAGSMTMPQPKLMKELATSKRAYNLYVAGGVPA